MLPEGQAHGAPPDRPRAGRGLAVRRDHPGATNPARRTGTTGSQVASPGRRPGSARGSTSSRRRPLTGARAAAKARHADVHPAPCGGSAHPGPRCRTGPTASSGPRSRSSATSSGPAPRGTRHDQPGRRGLDAVLQAILPVGAVSPPGAHQRLPGALDPQQVPMLRRDPRRPPEARGDHLRVSPHIPPLALGSRTPTDQDDKSPVTGDGHGGICGSRRVKLPPAIRPWTSRWLPTYGLTVD
jgi:hypothetical protein